MAKYTMQERIMLSRERTYEFQQELEATNTGQLETLRSMAYSMGETMASGVVQLVDAEIVAVNAATETPEE